MPVWQTLSVLALRPLVRGAAHAVGMSLADESTEGVVRFVAERLGDPSLRLPRALERSTDQAWRSLELALAGESLWSRLGRGDDRAFRAAVRQFLETALPKGTAHEFRQVCLMELRLARKGGALVPKALDADNLARQAVPLARFGDPTALLQAEWRLLDELADELRAEGRGALAQFVALRAGASPPLLANAVRFFFRRELESSPALFQGMTYEVITRIDAEQEAGFAALGEALTELGDRLDDKFDHVRDAVTATHADVLAVRGELHQQGRQMQELGNAILQALQPPPPPPPAKPRTPVQRDFDADVRDLLPDLAPIRECFRLEGHDGAVACVAFSPNGQCLLSGSADRTVRLWDVVTGRELRCLPGHRELVCAVGFSPDGRRALSASPDQSVRLWDVESGVQVHAFDQKTNRVVAFHPDGRHAASGGLHDGQVWLWEVDTGKPIRSYLGHGDWVIGLAFTPDGRGLMSAALDRTVRIWDVERGRALRSLTLSGDRSATVTFAPLGLTALTGGSDRILRLWELKNGSELARLVGHADTILSAAFTPDGHFAVSGGHDRLVLVWDLMRGRAVRKLTGHTGPVLCVAVSPDGKRFVSGSADGTLRVWEG